MDHSQPTAPPNGEAPERALRRSVINLRRLLHCMQTDEAPSDMGWEAIMMRADRAQALWREVQDWWNTTAEVREVSYPNQTAREQDAEAWIKLQQQVDHACRRAHEIAQDLRQGSDEIDWVNEIFLKEDETDDEESVQEEPSSAPEQEPQSPTSQQAEHPAAPKSKPHTATHAEVAELQKAQREQLEKEISHMVEQLKYNATHMHSTLKNQAENLDEMEDLATQNVQKVTKVTDDVSEHVRKQWRNTIATWTTMLTIFGTFLFCYLTIKAAPKRKNACVFFCPQAAKRSWKERHRYCVRQSDGTILCEDDQDVSGATPTESKEPPDDETCEETSEGECKAFYGDDDAMEEQDDDTEKEPSETCLPDGDDTCQLDSENGGGENGETGEDSEPPIDTERTESAPSNVESHETVSGEFDAKDVRRAAAQNRVEETRGFLRLKPEYAHVADKNGWQPIHEAARMGHTEIVRLLIDEAAVDVNARTGRKGPTGGTPLWWAYKFGLPGDHGVVELLKNNGAVSLGPDA